MKYEEYYKSDLALKEFKETLDKVPEDRLFIVYTKLTQYLKNMSDTFGV